MNERSEQRTANREQKNSGQSVCADFHTRSERGYTVILSLLFFTAISAVILIGLVRPVLAAHEAARAQVATTQAFLVANSAAEDVLHRLKSEMELASSVTLTLASGEAEIAVADTDDGKQINIESAAGDFERSLELVVEQGEGANFNYGLQVGTGGLTLSGSAGVVGNVYANGDITGGGSAYITGSASVANTSDPSADQSNGTVFPPAYGVDFGGNTTPQDAAQSFQVSTTTAVTSVRFYIKKSTTNWMNNITVRLTTDSSGKPSKTTLASATLVATQVTTSYNYLSVPFSSAQSLTPGTTYWLVLDTATTWGSYYSLGASSATYASGIGKTGAWSSSNGGTWNNTSPSGLDIYFDVYVGGDTGLIDDVDIGGSGGDAWAHEINDSNISGTAYCQAASNTNKACDTSRPDPVEQPFPISDGNIADWKAQAEAGGTTVGNVSYGGSTQATLGAQKIVGNLTVSSSARLTITGTIYVTGNVTVDGSGVLKLSSSYGENSGVLVADGRVSNGGSGKFQGSGTAGSYILVVTTSDCPASGSCSGNPAISASGSGESTIFNAQNGTIDFSGSAHTKQATAKRIIMSGSGTITYETGLADMSFSSGPSGGWNLTDWEEI